MNPNIEHYRDVQAMQHDADGPCFGVDKDAKQASIEARMQQYRDDFMLAALKNDPTEAEQQMVARCIDETIYPGSLRDLTIAAIKGRGTDGFQVANKILATAADYYADTEYAQS